MNPYIPSSDLADKVGLVASGQNMIHDQLIFEAPTAVLNGCCLIGKNEIGYLSYLCASTSIINTTIGRYCSIAEGVMIAPRNHPLDRISTHPFVYNFSGERGKTGEGPFEKFNCYRQLVDRENVLPISKQPRVMIGNDVWLGHHASIRAGVTIGHGAVVGAHAFVTRDVEPYTIVGGVPARPIRKRFDEQTIKALLALNWWNYDLCSVRNRLDYGDVHGFIRNVSIMIEKSEIRPLLPPKYLLNVGDGGGHITPCASNTAKLV